MNLLTEIFLFVLIGSQCNFLFRSSGDRFQQILLRTLFAAASYKIKSINRLDMNYSYVTVTTFFSNTDTALVSQ